MARLEPFGHRPVHRHRPALPRLVLDHAGAGRAQVERGRGRLIGGVDPAELTGFARSLLVEVCDDWEDILTNRARQPGRPNTGPEANRLARKPFGRGGSGSRLTLSARRSRGAGSHGGADMPQTPHLEKHFTASETVRDIVIGMSDGLTVPFALAAGLS